MDDFFGFFGVFVPSRLGGSFILSRRSRIPLSFLRDGIIKIIYTLKMINLRGVVISILSDF